MWNMAFRCYKYIGIGHFTANQVRSAVASNIVTQDMRIETVKENQSAYSAVKEAQKGKEFIKLIAHMPSLPSSIRSNEKTLKKKILQLILYQKWNGIYIPRVLNAPISNSNDY